VRQPKPAHRKTQTPIVAKQTQEKARIFYPIHYLVGICDFTKFVKIVYAKKGVVIPEEKIHLAFLIEFVWHIYYITKGSFCKDIESQFIDKKEKQRPRSLLFRKGE